MPYIVYGNLTRDATEEIDAFSVTDDHIPLQISPIPTPESSDIFCCAGAL